MAENTLVKSMRFMSDRILEDRKEVSLIMLLGNDEISEITAYDYIISAKWLDGHSQEDGMDIVLDYFFDIVPLEDRLHISRITIIHTDDPIVQNITHNIYFQGGIAYNIDCVFGNLTIPFAIIFESRRKK